MGLHVLALARQLYPISAASLILVLSGLVLALARTETLCRLAFPLGFLLLMIPWPYLERTTPYLARWVANAAATITRAMGLEVITSGARVELPEATLVIGAPCSGVNSLAALMTLAVLYAFLVRGALGARLALVILALPIALLANLVRVCLLVLLAHSFGAEAAMRYFHYGASPFLFLLALGMLILVGKGLRSGMRPRPTKRWLPALTTCALTPCLPPSPCKLVPGRGQNWPLALRLRPFPPTPSCSCAENTLTLRAVCSGSRS